MKLGVYVFTLYIYVVYVICIRSIRVGLGVCVLGVTLGVLRVGMFRVELGVYLYVDKKNEKALVLL